MISLKSTWEERASQCTERWHLSALRWREHNGTAKIAFCESPFGKAVLKVSNEAGMVGYEAKALDHFGTEICPAVFALAEDLESILLEEVDAVGDLSDWYPDAEREVETWIPFFWAVEGNKVVPDGFPTLSKYAEVFDRALENHLPSELKSLMVIGDRQRGILTAPEGQNRLLHGDMHHFNLLKGKTDSWRLIDPHGVVGHPYYELGAFLRNPWGACYTEPGVKERLDKRVYLLAEKLGITPCEVAKYGFYGAAFSIAWSIEDGSDDLEGMIVMANTCLTFIGESF